jgi:hypothetical protein
MTPDHLRGRITRKFEQINVGVDIGVAQHRHPALARTEEFARAAQRQILSRDLEPVGILVDDFHALPRGF